MARQRGYPAEEVEAIRQQTYDVARAPAAGKMGLLRRLDERVRFNEAKNITPPAPAEEAGGRTAPAPAPPPPGPRITTPAGTSVSLRHLPIAAVKAHAATAAAAGDAEGAAAANTLLNADAYHQMHANGNVPPGLVHEWAAAKVKPGNAAMTASRLLRAKAGVYEKEDPDLSQKLHEASDLAAQGFRRNWLADQGVAPAAERTGPVMVSPWRKLSPEQQAKLPLNVRTALLVQDASHSLENLDPAHRPVASALDLPGKPKTAQALEELADRLHDQASAVVSHRLAPPVVPPTPTAEPPVAGVSPPAGPAKPLAGAPGAPEAGAHRTAETGRPLAVTGYRMGEAGTAHPETGVFYSTNPEDVQIYNRGGQRVAGSAELSFLNPLVFDGNQIELAQRLGELPLSEAGKEQIRVAATRAALQRIPGQGYPDLDRRSGRCWHGKATTALSTEKSLISGGRKSIRAKLSICDSIPSKPPPSPRGAPPRPPHQHRCGGQWQPWLPQ